MPTSKTLFHVTLCRNLPSIKRLGLLTSRDARGKGRVWLCKESSLAWAILHVSGRHKRAVCELCVIPTTVQDAHRSGRAGIEYVTRDVEPERLVFSSLSILE